MPSFEERTDKRLFHILSIVSAILIIILYIIYEYNYGGLNKVVVLNDASQKYIIRQLKDMSTPDTKMEEVVEPAPQTQPAHQQQWEFIDESVGQLPEPIDPDAFYKRQYHQYAVDDDFGYASY